jgi:hypothetical protein
MAEPEQPDLFAGDSGPPPGTIEGPPDWFEGFGAGLRCWCGPAIGWRDFGEIVGIGRPEVIVHQHGRLRVGLTWDLGQHTFPRPRREEAAQDG